MPNLKVFDMSGKEAGEIELSDVIFGIKPHTGVMHMAVVNYLANRRQGTQSALTRAEVRGGGRKPWRQKGTGRARHGSTRSPIWTHGGVTFAPKPRDYSYRLNKKVKRLALKSALSSKAADNDIIVLDSIAAEEYKTKTIIKMLSSLGADKKALIVLKDADDKIIKSSSNIPGVSTICASSLNVYDILNHDKLIAAKDAIARIEEVFA
ncbi:MAG: 50S ribosomal protein L4 [Oscillospiraceae bacterium]|nr:50S ribosomal protein L4 [Oscillospiraceae bacterium]